MKSKRKYVVYRVPSTWNSVTFIIKHYSDGHYYINEELPVFYQRTGSLLNKRFVRTSKRWLKEMFNYE